MQGGYRRAIDTIKPKKMQIIAIKRATLIFNQCFPKAKVIHAPIIQEAFINMECSLKEVQDLSGAGITAMIIGQVQHISVDEKYAQGYEPRYGKEGFMMLIPAPQNLTTGEPNQSAVATVNIEKYD